MIYYTTLIPHGACVSKAWSRHASRRFDGGIMRPRTSVPLSPHSGARASTECAELTRNSILRITDVKTIQLIQAWEKEECLWNTNLPNYPNKEERLGATAIIAEKLNLPNFRPEHVTMKFKNLRNSYCQELKKMAADENYKPKVFWFAHMDKFLKPHLQKINSYTDKKKALEDKTKYTYMKTEIDSDEDRDWTIENSTQSEASCSNSMQIESTYTEAWPSEVEGNSNQSEMKKRKLSTDSRCENLRLCNENGETLNQAQDRHSEKPAKVPKTTSKKEVAPDLGSRKVDYCDTFGTYVASLMRLLPRKKALMLQPKIVDLIVTVGLEELIDEDSDS